MATQTETYKLNKPARTDTINIEDLNKNFDIIEEELKKRALNENIPTASFYDLNLTSLVTVNFTGYDVASFTIVTITDNVDGAAVLAAIAAGRLPRVKFLNSDGSTETIVLDVCESTTTNENTTTQCIGTASNVIHDAYDSFCLKIVETNGEYAVSFLAYRYVSGAGTVKTVNGVEPDDDGNVEITVTGKDTTKLDFTNWDNGSFTEYLDDGTSVVHTVTRDSDGNITAVGGITIVGVVS